MKGRIVSSSAAAAGCDGRADATHAAAAARGQNVVGALAMSQTH